MVVKINPFGSVLSPGIMNLAITPTIKPMRIVQRMLIVFLQPEQALGTMNILTGLISEQF
jgi:hypothetical protein